jgi:protein gp37
MANHSNIEWTDATWNPITGCSVVSAGCKHCYAMKLAGTRMKNEPSRAGLTIDTAAGPVWNGQVRFNAQWLDQPLRWKRPRRIFVCAHGDLFHENVPDAWIDRVFAVMALAPQHTFQVLTKRPERMHRYLLKAESMIRDSVKYEAVAETMQWPLQNVWLGVSVENQVTADARMPLLAATPAAVRWISAEPLLGLIDLRSIQFFTIFPKIDWLIFGGESGPRARPMHPDWARSLRDQCAELDVPFLFKQWGEWVNPKAAGLDLNHCYDKSRFGGYVELDGHWSAGENAVPHTTGAAHIFRVGKKAAGRLLDGVQHDGYPTP